MLYFLQSFMQYGADKAQYKASKAWQKYKNTMVNLSNAVAQNDITDNEILMQQASTATAVNLKRGNIINTARAEVSAAAAQVKGRSVNQTMLDINRNAAMAERQRQIAFENANLEFDHQRQQSQMSAAMQQDYSYIPKPNLASYMLDATIKTMQAAGGAPPGSNGTGAPNSAYSFGTSTGGQTGVRSVQNGINSRLGYYGPGF